MDMIDDLTYNEAEGRYEMDSDEHIAYARTHQKDDVLFIDYVYTPPELRGQGAASRLMKALMALVQDEGWRVKPICGFAAGWLRRHAEYDGVVV